MKEKYSVTAADGKRKAGKSKDALAKFGAVCCDCDDKEAQKKCDGKKLPAFSVFNDAKKKTFDYEMGKWNVDDFAGFVLEKMELVGERKAEGKKEEL